jgi:NTE family protein
MTDIKTRPGDDFDLAGLNQDLTRIYGRGDFSYVDYSIIPDKDNANIIIGAETRPWGPGYLKLGLSVETDFSSISKIDVATSYRRTWLNDVGAELRVDTQFGYDTFIRSSIIQPMQFRDGGFVEPYIEAKRDFSQFYLQEIRAGEYEHQRLVTGLDLGVSGKPGELRIGPFVSRIEGKPDFGIATPFLEEEQLTQVGIKMGGVYDQLDKIYFPRSGLRAAFDLTATETDWGAEDEYSKLRISLTAVKSYGEHSLSSHLEWGDEISGADDLPTYDVFELGGPGRLSGLYLDQLSGSRYRLASLHYYREISKLPPQIGHGVYLGGSLEAGRINDSLMEDPWDWIYAGSLFWGLDTILGKLTLSFGINSLDQKSFYLRIGN